MHGYKWPINCTRTRIGAQSWPPEGFNVSSRPVQAILLGIFRPGQPYANTSAHNASYSCLRDVLECEAMKEVPLDEEHLASMPLEADISAAREKHAKMLAAVRSADGVAALEVIKNPCMTHIYLHF